MKRWFGPKLFGIGASPASWEGWLVTAAFIAAFLLVPHIPGVTRPNALIAYGVLLVVFLIIVRLTYGPKKKPDER